MSDRARRHMTEAEFLDWQAGQEERYELVDGEPRAMIGARFRHERVAGNAFAALRAALRAAGNPCDPFTDDMAVRVPNGNLRRPDVAVYCPPIDEEAMVSDRPQLVVEVLSESTEDADQFVKLDEYQAVEALDCVILVAPHVIDAVVWQRTPQRRWSRTRHRKMDEVIALSALGISLAVLDLYDRVELRPRRRPRLVWDEAEDG
jgi:Uma2 family endonuclease